MIPTFKRYFFEILRDARNMFISGLLVVVPLGFTIFIIVSLFNFFDGWFRSLKSYWLNDPPNWIVENISENTKAVLDHFIDSLPPFGVGFCLTLVLIFLIGFMTRIYLGQRMVKLVEWLFNLIPGVSMLYKGVKQVFEQLVGKGHKIFERVVLIEYPRKGIYSIAFVTGPAEYFNPIVNKKMFYVFVVTTPNPTSGFFMMVLEEEMIPTDLGIEEAMKMAISGGIVTPKPVQNPLLK